ncbi:MAG: hypothetical protein RLZZ450_332 [Pseudomonadota bacterium]
MGAAGALVCIASIIGDETLGLLLGLIAFMLVVFAMVRVPVRVSMMSLAFLATILPNPGEGQPTKLEPPFSMLGKVLLDHLNTVDRGGLLGLLPVSTMELLFLILFIIMQVRKSTRSNIDTAANVPTPRPLIQLAYLSLAATGFTWLKGLATGGDFAMSLWQVNAVIYLPVIFLLMQSSLRGPEDHWPIAKLYLIAAGYKAALAIYVVEVEGGLIDTSTGTQLPAPYGTAHADSMLFALAFVIIVAGLLEQVNKRWRKLAYFMLPLLALGTQSNNRRLAWVQIGIVLLVIYIVSEDNKVKRFVRKAVYASIPIATVYVIAGWNVAYGRFFRPVRILRSVVDAESDASSQWREFENVNIIATLRDNLLFGTGYGHPYYEVIPLPAVDYALERYIPHNSFLGLWAYAGYVGFTGLTLLWTAGVYYAMRSYYGATQPQHRAAAIVCFGAIPIYLLQCFGDLGLSTWTGMFMMASAISLGGKLAVATGQWQDGPWLKKT